MLCTVVSSLAMSTIVHFTIDCSYACRATRLYPARLPNYKMARTLLCQFSFSGQSPDVTLLAASFSAKKIFCAMLPHNQRSCEKELKCEKSMIADIAFSMICVRCLVMVVHAYILFDPKLTYFDSLFDSTSINISLNPKIEVL